MNKTSFEEIEENNLDGLFMLGANPNREHTQPFYIILGNGVDKKEW